MIANAHVWISGAVAVLVGIALWLALFKGKGGTALKNRQPTGHTTWDAKDVAGSLLRVLEDVEGAAKSATDWYWTEKGPKARASRFIRAASVILTVFAGLVPVAIELLSRYENNQKPEWWATGLWATVLVGAAGGLLGLDRAFGFSSAWARYVLAATEITRRLAEFRMDWLTLSAVATQNTPPSAEQVNALLQKAKEFRLAVEAVVVQETKDWATEFQNNLAQLEKDVKVQFEALKAQVEKQQQERQAASEPGSIEATIPNADKTRDFTLFVSLDGSEGAFMEDEKVLNNKTWTKLSVKPGQYKLTIAADTVATAAEPSRRVSQSAVVAVKTGELAKVSVALPIA
jgi:SMODS and SLOG-associating 2TM effector domain 2